MQPHKPITVSAEELEHMRDQTFVWDVDLPAGAIQDDDMDVLAVEGQLTLKKQLNFVLCLGKLKTQVRLTSDRTLTVFETEIPIAFEEGLEIVADPHLPAEYELNPEDAAEQITADQPIDLIELIRQYLILNLPMQKNDPENCYNEDLSRYARSREEEIDPTWEAIRKTVETWENPSQN